MYRFLIIDDEPVVREGISENIDWQAYGFELVGACRDGREGLQAIDDLKPDVVLTDICMPFVDGLELAGAIAEEHPGTKTILLTGYDEFEYAQEAVKLKVSDFLLKPITPDELRSVLVSLKQQLDTERNRQRQLDRLHAQLKESVPVLRERFLNRLVTGAAARDEIARRIELLELNLPGPAFNAVVCRPERAEAEQDLAQLAVENLIADVARERGGAVSFSTPRDYVVVLVSAENREAALARALECGERVSERVAGELGGRVSIGTGSSVDDLALVWEAYQHARIAMEYRLVLGSSQVITVEQVRGGAPQSAALSNASDRSRFVSALKRGAGEEASEALRRIVSCFETERRESCFVEMNRLLSDTLNGLESIGIDYRRIPELGSKPFERLNAQTGPRELQRWFLAVERGARELLADQQQEHSTKKAEEAKAYIRAHYMEPGLSLHEVCSALSISKSYLSAIFKSHTGMTLVEYLTGVRMEAAKELLARDTLRGYEVAAQVGFKDAHYFSLTFKKQTGISPTEYRELARQGAQ